MLKAYIWLLIICAAYFYTLLNAIEIEDEEDVKSLKEAVTIDEEVVAKPFPLGQVKLTATHRDINCENFSDYALNCTMSAALMYNSNRKSPPLPKKVHDWCRAVKYLTNCALEWNMDCRDVTDSHFNEESINGHSYVVHNICNDKNFLDQYMDLSVCVDNTADQWEHCYTTFKNLVDGFKKNTTADWTHYETHFYLCCGRAKFRRCILDVVFKRSDVCTRSQAIILQKFSVIVSEGDVYQDCDFNMMYPNCPGGDPRPRSNDLGLSQVDSLGTERAVDPSNNTDVVPKTVDEVDQDLGPVSRHKSSNSLYPGWFCPLLWIVLMLFNIAMG